MDLHKLLRTRPVSEQLQLFHSPRPGRQVQNDQPLAELYFPYISICQGISNKLIKLIMYIRENKQTKIEVGK